MNRAWRWTLLALPALGLAAAAAVVWSGVYDVSATTPHLQPVHSMLELSMQRAVRRHARDVAVPPLGDAQQVRRGAACFQDKCVQCHGAPGLGQQPVGQSMQPLPGPLVDAAQRFGARELYWITRHGIKMSGMPAWGPHLDDADLWALVAFMQRLPQLTPDQYRALAGAAPARCDRQDAAGSARPAPNAERGRAILHLHACTACHTIPGTTGSDVHVGPPLAGIGGRQLIAGVLPNTPEHMARWIMDPQGVDPATAMPDLGVDERDARDMAAYLAKLR